MEFVQDPAPPLHVAPVAPPPILPPIAAEVPLWQIADNAAPAVAVGAVLTVIETCLVVPFPTQLLGVTVNVPLVVAFNDMLFPEPVIVPVPL